MAPTLRPRPTVEQAPLHHRRMTSFAPGQGRSRLLDIRPGRSSGNLWRRMQRTGTRGSMLGECTSSSRRGQMTRSLRSAAKCTATPLPSCGPRYELAWPIPSAEVDPLSRHPPKASLGGHALAAAPEPAISWSISQIPLPVPRHQPRPDHPRHVFRVCRRIEDSRSPLMCHACYPLRPVLP